VDDHLPTPANDDYPRGSDPHLAERARRALLRLIKALAEEDEARESRRDTDV